MLRVLLAVGILSVSVIGCGGRQLPVIPLPSETRFGEGTVPVSSSDTVLVSGGADRDGFLSRYIAQNLSHPSCMASTEEHRTPIVLSLDDSFADPEEYSLAVTAREIRISAKNGAGLFYGVQTLVQCASNGRMPVMEIRDRPRFSYRGFHLDASRHFFSAAFVKRCIDIMSRYKFNTFHWHLTDDQGWRLPVAGYPRLVRIGSVRGGADPASGFYTRDEIRDIVRFAAERHVEVIPEVDMPGHSAAAVASYPQLSCRKKPIPVASVWPASEDLLCGGSPETDAFVRAVIDELCALFPSKRIHIGGDEAVLTRWKECPVCGGRISRLELRDVHGLRRDFIRRVRAYAASKGKSVIGWDENVEADAPRDMTIMAWSGITRGAYAASKGYRVIQSPARFCYFDKYQTDPATEPRAAKGYLSAHMVYAWDPLDGVGKDDAQRVLGAEWCLWTEFVPDEATAELRLFPRALAAAEVAWSAKGARSWRPFRVRAEAAAAELEKSGVNVRKGALYEPLWGKWFAKNFRSGYLR